MRDDIAGKIEYFETLKTKREKWNAVWDELKKYVCPQTTSNKEIFDSTSIWAREQLASGLQSLMVNRAVKWFNINLLEQEGSEDDQPLNELPEVKLWLETIENTILNIFNNPGSNFYNQIHEFFLNLAAFGTSIFYVEEEPELRSGLFFRNISLKECYFEEDKYGFVNSMYRLFTMNVKTAASKWSDFAPFKDKLLKSPDEQIEILHIVAPADEGGKKKSLAYTSQYIYLAEQKLIAESGYSYFPFFVTRWIKEEGEVYGYAPAHHVLPDIKLLNSFRNTTAKVSQLQLQPSRLIPKRGYQLPLRDTPGAANYFENGTEKITNLSNIDNPVATELQQDKCRDAIFKASYIDIFRMQKENKEMTATEVQIRNEEQMRMMSPMVGRIETEFLNPLIRAIYGILAKYNKLPALEGVNILPDIEISYVSPLTRAQKSSAVNSIEQVIGFFQRSGISNLCPEIYDNINWDLCFKLLAEHRGIPQSILRPDKEVMQIRQQRKMAQAQQMQAQQSQLPIQ
ncbi:portal protein [Rickettsia endosymbiont of Polydrusus tereticollis]|uniref:portal protein n=1 Tax=Rickettsia endosymbiont of Polydrusus tereticollis TaxID=3066251 RepID=UPI003132A3BC